MKIDIGQDEAAEAGRRRADILAGLAKLMAHIETHLDEPLPVVTASYRIPAGPRGERVDYLDKLADSLGVGVAGDDMGNLLAIRRFGDDVTAEGHLAPEDRSMRAWREAAEHRNAVGANGATA